MKGGGGDGMTETHSKKQRPYLFKFDGMLLHGVHGRGQGRRGIL